MSDYILSALCIGLDMSGVWGWLRNRITDRRLRFFERRSVVMSHVMVPRQQSWSWLAITREVHRSISVTTKWVEVRHSIGDVGRCSGSGWPKRTTQDFRRVDKQAMAGKRRASWRRMTSVLRWRLG